MSYLTALKMIPWDEVVRRAPMIIDGSKKLWSTLGKQPPPATDNTEARLAMLEAQVVELQQELSSSAALIKELADQNSQLIHAVDVLHNRSRFFIGALTAIGVVCVICLVLLLSRA